jgi:hypothetical protein
VSINSLATFLTSELTVVDASVTFLDASVTLVDASFLDLSPSADVDCERPTALDLDPLSR